MKLPLVGAGAAKAARLVDKAPAVAAATGCAAGVNGAKTIVIGLMAAQSPAAAGNVVYHAAANADPCGDRSVRELALVEEPANSQDHRIGEHV